MKLYDTLSATSNEFVPATNEVKMYVCGPNLYGPCHLGHALSYVVFDVLRRYLEYKGYHVLHIQNFTDIEDRIIEVAKAENRSIGELAEQYIQRFLEEMDALGVKRAHHYPKATEYIPSMIEIIQGLLAKDHAYAVNGDVYFRVDSLPNYGRLSKRTLKEMEAGARVEIDPRKENPMDFALWKASKDGEPSWPSPWGEGRPGWHIECSAMSLSLLGEQFDIHGGGRDVIFPHHENEIAQSEGYTTKSPVVRFWVHNGLLRLDGDDDDKMTRHQGNFISCKDALAEHHPDALRLFILSSHYRSPRAYSEKELASQERALQRIHGTLRDSEATSGETLKVEEYRTRFQEAMDNDLNTPRALAVLFDLVRDANRSREEGMDIANAQALLRDLGGILGLTFEQSQETDKVAAQPFIELLMEIRAQLRQGGQFALADSIRDKLVHMGVSLEDNPQGTIWRFREVHGSS